MKQCECINETVIEVATELVLELKFEILKFYYIRRIIKYTLNLDLDILANY